MFSQRSIRLTTLTKQVMKYNPRWTTHVFLALTIFSCLPNVLALGSFPSPDKDESTTELQSTVTDSIGLPSESPTTDQISSFSVESATTENTFMTSTETLSEKAHKVVVNESQTRADVVLLERVNVRTDGFLSPPGTNLSNDSTTRIANQTESHLRDSEIILVSSSGKNPNHPVPETAETKNSINNSTSLASPFSTVDFPDSFGGEGDSAFPGPKNNNTEIGISDPKASGTTMEGVTEGHATTERFEINIPERTAQVIATDPLKNTFHDGSDPPNSEGNVFESAEINLLRKTLQDDSRPTDDSTKTFGVSKGRSLDGNLLNITVNHHLNESQYLHEEEPRSFTNGREVAPTSDSVDSKIFYIEPASTKRDKEDFNLFDDIRETNKNLRRKSKSLGSVQDINNENHPSIDENEFHIGLPSRDNQEEKTKPIDKSDDLDQEFIESVGGNSSKFIETETMNKSDLVEKFSSTSAVAILEVATPITPTEYQSKINSSNFYEIDPKQRHTSEGSNRATELFIRLLKENQALKTILHHITNNTANSLKTSVSYPTLSTKRSKELDQTTLPSIEAELETTALFEMTDSPTNRIEIKNLSNSSPASRINISDSFETIFVNGSQDLDLNKNNINITIASEIATDNNALHHGVTNDSVSDHYAHVRLESVVLEANTSVHKMETKDKVTSDHIVNNEPQPIVSHNEEDYDEQDQSLGSSVRKCCGPAQFFSLDTQACEESGGETNFRPLLHQLVLGDTGAALVLMPGRLQICPGTGKPPQIQVGISNYTILLDQGFLYDIARAEHFDHGVYCLELVGHDPQDAQLTAAFCPAVAPEIAISTIRKCCPLEEYYDTVLMGCAPKQAGMKNISDLVHDFSGSYTESTSIETGRLTCQEGAPDLVDASKVYLGGRDQLCVSQTGRCYPSTLYCIEYMWAPDAYHEQPSAVFCPLDSFQKCCPPDQIVMDDMCVDSHVEYLSPFITQLMATLNYQVGFPIHDSEICVHLLLDSQDEIRWWVTNSGFLVIDSDNSQIHTKNYCVDDSLEPSGKVFTLAHVCSNELKQSIVLPLSVFEKGTIGKCCQPDHHLSPMHQDCASGGSFKKIDADPLLKNSSITALGYTGYPHCQSGIYHLYTFTKKTEDHVEFGEDSKLYVVSLDGECIEKATPVEISDFCVDYGWDAEDPELPAAIVCAPEWENNELHTEKYNLTASLLGVSCFSLLIALFSLISMRVRRGLVTIRKINTLAGRILISYVTAHLIGFLTLAVSMHIDVQDNTASCMLIAAVMQFFLLAGFCWNTSICSESLLLTLRVSTSEGRRFLYHSLWAWGVPALITSFALIMDSLRHSLPCGTITPRIGRFKCFFSDPDAALLYFYLPIALTLIANLVLLITSRNARLAKLKRLERGPAKPTGHTDTVSGAGGTQVTKKASLKNSPSGGSGGMRTHQNRNLWSESMRLVLWSGGTWLFEVLGFVAARYISPPQERWYDYLWYLPAAINSLRGFGIFFILVMTEENRGRIFRAIGTIRGKSSAMFRSDRSKTVRKMSCANANNVSMSVNSSGYAVCNRDKIRNMSVATTVTRLTALNHSMNQDVTKPHARVAYSISQVQRQNSTTSSQSSNSETEENETMETGFVGMGGGRRRSSAAPVSLPSVDEEEDDFVETSLSVVPSPHPSPPDSIFIRESHT